ncbi:MAG: YraN family protein [Anaerolineales bacterium]
MNHNQKIGKWGEGAAAEYLTARGYQIVERNVRTPYGEIDLVARIDGFTVFVEVKARTTRRFGLPEEALTKRKLRHMRAAAGHYAAEHEIDNWHRQWADRWLRRSTPTTPMHPPRHSAIWALLGDRG